MIYSIIAESADGVHRASSDADSLLQACQEAVVLKAEIERLDDAVESAITTNSGDLRVGHACHLSTGYAVEIREQFTQVRPDLVVALPESFEVQLDGGIEQVAIWR